MTYKDDAKASRREKMGHYADGGSVRSSDAQIFGPENEPGPTDNPRDYGRYPASLGEKISGVAKLYGQMAGDLYDKAKRATK